MAAEQLGRVVVAQGVLASVVEMTALTVPGVVRLVPRNRLVERATGRAAAITVEGNAVRAEIGIVVAADSDVNAIGATVRQKVVAAVERILGMEAQSVNVVVWDVEGAPMRPVPPTTES